MPASIGEALALLRHPQTRIVAGGTDLFPALGTSLGDRRIIDVSQVPEMHHIGKVDGGWHLGAAATWMEVQACNLPPAFDGLKAAARQVGAVQIQNRGTIAGNICNASPAADGVPPLLTLDAEVEIAGPTGARRRPLSAFILGPRRIDLADGDVVTGVFVPDAAAVGHGRFHKLGSRSSLVISVAMVAVRVAVAAGRIADVAIAVGSCSPVACRLPNLEAALKGLDQESVAALDLTSAELFSGLTPLDDVRGSAAYRLGAVAQICRDAVRAAMKASGTHG